MARPRPSRLERLALPCAAALAIAGVLIAGELGNARMGARSLPPADDAPPPSSGGAVYNLRVITDASPDLTDLKSFIDSTTSSWTADRDKVWALFYWSHILKRQTAPMMMHGFEVTDPIRNFQDYGFTMCSTISGINQSLYDAIGLEHQFWDICNHTVTNVAYDGAFHMVDSSMSNLVTTDDGTTLASVQEAAADAARLVRERSLYATSPNGFLTGSDTLRNLADFLGPDGSTAPGYADNFCAGGLLYRDYYYNWDTGHRYVLNLRENESYTRYYRPLGTTADYWVPSESVDNPNPASTKQIDSTNRFGIRGNGSWTFVPPLTPAAWAGAAYSSSNIAAAAGGGLEPAASAQPASVVYKVQAANAITSQTIQAQFSRSDAQAAASISLSLNHGTTWTPVGSLGAAIGAVPLTVTLRAEVAGAYETLIRVDLSTPGSTDGVILQALRIDTLTEVNIKALPKLNAGKNEIYIGAGDQTDTMVLWPELRGDFWKKDVYDSSNIATQGVSVPRRYTAVAYPAVLNQDAYLTYRLQAPQDIARLVYGGRLHNFAPGSYIDFLHSFDGGATWIQSYRLSDVNKPYDVIHYETVENVPPGVRTVLFKYSIHNTNTTAARASGLYSVRMEADYAPAGGSANPIDVTFRWNEVRADRTTIARSHRQRVTTFPFKYVIDVGGSDHPVMESIKLNVADDSDTTPFGYGDGIDAGGDKYVYAKETVGANVAAGKPYTFSRAPSGFQASADASNTTVLTDGVVGAPMTGGISYWWGQCWTAGQNVDLQIDLGTEQSVSAFRAHLFGYPFWDALKGEVQDQVEVLTSLDGTAFTSQGVLRTGLWRRDIPINYMLLDDEHATAWNFELTTPPVSARFVRYHVMPARDLCTSELQVFDRIDYQPFDIGLTLPDATPAPPNQPPVVGLSSPASGTVYQSPASVTISADASDADGSIARVDFFAGSTLVGSATSAPYGTTWATPAAGQYTIVARAYDNAGAAAQSAPVTIAVQAPPSTGLEDIVLWASDATIGGGWSVTADTTAAGGKRLQNPNAGAAKVVTASPSPSQYFELTFNPIAGRGYRLWIRGKALQNSYANDSVHVQFEKSLSTSGAAAYRIGTTSSVEYNLEECGGCGVSGWGWEDDGWGAVNAMGPLVYFASDGPQKLRVQMREDGLGIDQIVLSSTRWLSTRPGTARNDTVILLKTGGTPSNQPPSASITSPAGGATFTNPASVSLAASASDADGTVARVDFLVDGSVIASDTASPWSATWNSSAAGAHTIVARAVDNTGAQTDSAPVTITVQAAANQPPTVSISSPASGTAYTAPASVAIAANASDADGSVARVDFFVDGGVIASDTAAPWTATWSSSAAGSHTIVAKAFDNAGASTSSSPVTISIQTAPPPANDVVLWAADATMAFGWTLTADSTAAGGKRLQNPNAGAAKVVTASPSPTQYFEMAFNAVAGRGYRLWIRGKATSNNYANDSVHVQFDNSLNASGAAAYRIGTTSSVEYNLEECNGCGVSGWGWEDNGWGAVNAMGPLIYFQTTGPQRIRIQVREDGLGIDQIVLSSSQWLTSRPGKAKSDTVILPKTQ